MTSPVNHTVISPTASPYLTPKTRRLYAFGESPSQALDGINRMMQRPDKYIDFDEEETKYELPSKRVKQMHDILEGDDVLEEQINIPSQAFNNYK